MFGIILTQLWPFFFSFQCYEKYNNPDDGLAYNYPLCAAELKDAMNGAKDSITCIRRSNHFTSLTTSMSHYCDPLGDKNVLGFVNSKTKDEQQQNKSVIIAACRVSFFIIFFILKFFIHLLLFLARGGCRSFIRVFSFVKLIS